ncbi:MAG: TrkA family potassium uptake protein [Candidatus Vecturithrix sp.]|jgi:trk system potassium uptake protein TrkA|nr:TrkA family potassium uptake protein [Candidatus Vecturithrix sp.]
MKKRFVVIGLGIFGRKVATSLAEMGAEVIAIDKNFELIDDIKEQVLMAVQMDATNREALELQGIKEVDAAIVGIGEDFEECLLTVVTLKKIGVSKVISRAGTRLRKEVLEQVGCDLVVLPEEEVGHNVAKELISGLFFDQVEVGDNYSIAQLVAPDEFVGRKVIDLQLRETYKVNIVTIKRPTSRPTLWGKQVTQERIIAVPKPDDVIVKGDILVLFGHDRDLGKLAEIFENV